MVLGYHVFVIVFGAYVRVSFSGDGCGNHWPLCNGSVLPDAHSATRTFVEFSHRVTSGLAGLLAMFLVWAVRKERRSVRRAAWGSLFFDAMEAIIGAALVKLRLVGDNPTMKRALSGSFHLVNTFFLLAVLALVVVLLRSRAEKSADVEDRARPAPTRGLSVALFVGAFAIILTAMSGAVAAFGDLLNRFATLSEAVMADFSGASSSLVRLRVFHPGIDFASAVLIFGIATAVRWLRPASKNFARVAMVSLGVQVALGIANVLLLAPNTLQLSHLFVAQIFWIAYVMMSVTALRSEAPAAESTNAASTSEASTAT